MKKLIKMATVVVGIGTMLGIAGCGLEDSLVETQVEEMVTEHVKGQEEIMKLYDVDKCQNFAINPESNGFRSGTIDVGLKSKKTGKVETLAYEFKYNTKNDTIEAGVKDPRDAIRLIGLKNLLK